MPVGQVYSALSGELDYAARPKSLFLAVCVSSGSSVWAQSHSRRCTTGASQAALCGASRSCSCDLPSLQLAAGAALTRQSWLAGLTRVVCGRKLRGLSTQSATGVRKQEID